MGGGDRRPADGGGRAGGARRPPPRPTGRRTAYLNFAQHAQAAQANGWLQARWHEDGGATVRDVLSYNAVWDVNPFEVGARREMTRRAFREQFARVARLLDLRRMLARPLIALSNGETRRVLLARALLKAPEVLVLEDPAAGLDAKQRERMKDILCALARRGVSILLYYRHIDEVPGGGSGSSRRQDEEDSEGLTGFSEKQGGRPQERKEILSINSKSCSSCLEGQPVVEVRGLTLRFGRRTLFRDFSWTVREGERWWLKGENGKGKTTLLSLICGDNPMAYAADIAVFGEARRVGSELARVRRRIGMVSPEMQAYLGAEPLSLIKEALRRRPRLLLLDEPFMNLDADATRRAARLVTDYLDATRRAAAVLICHRADEVPASFTRILDLDTP